VRRARRPDPFGGRAGMWKSRKKMSNDEFWPLWSCGVGSGGGGGGGGGTCPRT